MKNKNKLFKIMAIITMYTFYGCSDILNEKSDYQLVTPVTVQDNQALLDKISNMLGDNSISGEISSDDIYITDSDYNGVSYDADKRLYIWEPDYVARNTGNDWSSCYSRINVCNTVLHNIQQYGIKNSENVKGQALVLRASIYLEAAQLWAPVFNKIKAGNELGLPLRLDPDFNQPSIRTSVQETYTQILRDLQTAIPLLPNNQISVSRASKQAALAYMARTYLFMGEYQNALNYAKEALQIKNELLDFNNLNFADSYPIKEMNTEVILPTILSYSPILGTNMAKIVSELYNLYENNDLRKVMFFRTNTAGEILFKGNYSGSSSRSSAIATDELYLIAAESYAQLDDVKNALLILNQLMVKRWKNGTFIPFTATDKTAALQLIAKERRKELLFRGIRWADLKRYNRDGKNIFLQRTVNGKTYQLPPNDPRYALAIPEDIIKLTGMSQNPR